ncbi:MAG TPA: uracil-DNA glycosylase [Fibrobacteres bacterium]|nr:uracil-DNA glycosylase [Fibrobacterota bacterium]
MQIGTNIDCFKCKHYYITWDNKFPRGCRLFKFKSKYPPSRLVLESTGAPCDHFVLNTKGKPVPSKSIHWKL